MRAKATHSGSFAYGVADTPHLHMRKLLSRKVYQLNYPHGPYALLRIFLESHMGLGSHLVLLDSSLPVSFRLQYPPCNHFYTIRRMDVKALSPAHFMRGIVHCGGAGNRTRVL